MPLIVRSPGAEAQFAYEGAIGFSQDIDIVPKRLDVKDRVTIDSVRNHCERHFPVQSIARATYRDIVECRAKQNGVDFVNGMVTALTPLAFLSLDAKGVPPPGG
jgi:hypothetical protein